MRKIFAMLAVMLAIGATLPAYANVPVASSDDSAYRAMAGGGGH